MPSLSLQVASNVMQGRVKVGALGPRSSTSDTQQLLRWLRFSSLTSNFKTHLLGTRGEACCVTTAMR